MKANTLICLPNQQLRLMGAAILRVSAELDDFLEGEDVPTSLRDDIAAMKNAGAWLVTASSITLPQQFIPTAGHAATGFPSAAAPAAVGFAA